jgi:hypothetical protein
MPSPLLVEKEDKTLQYFMDETLRDLKKLISENAKLSAKTGTLTDENAKLMAMMETVSTTVGTLSAAVRSLVLDRFWITARTVMDAFIMDVIPETHASDDRLQVLLLDGADKMKQAGVLPLQALSVYVKVHHEGGYAAHNLSLVSICRDLKAAKEVFGVLSAAGLTSDDLDCLEKLTLFLGKIPCLDIPGDTSTMICGSFVDWKGRQDHADKEFQRGLRLLNLENATEEEQAIVEFGY